MAQPTLSKQIATAADSPPLLHTMIDLVNTLFRLHMRRYQQELEWHYEMPLQLQQDAFWDIIRENAETVYGRKHNFRRITHPRDYAEAVPTQTYDDLQPYIDRAIRGEEDVLTTDKIKWVAKTSGTTSGTSKYIPVTRRNIQECHAKGSWMALASLYTHREDLKIFAKKNLLIGGGIYDTYPNSDIIVGDISAIMIQSIPLVVRPFYVPDVKTATLPNYEEKIKIIAEIGAREDSITMLGGVPTWNLTLYRRILEITGASNLLEVWPHLQAYIHGGVSFGPYRQHFEEIIPSPDFLFLEVYNASEGFFAVQDRLEQDDLLLLLNNGIYYEFIPFDEYIRGERTAIPLADVRTDTPYVLIITTNTGLYRYQVGDVLTFTATNPFRFKITGRTQEFINAFGEDLLLDNTERALVDACRQHDATIKEYTIAPYYIKLNERGRHQWFIEFDRPPRQFDLFTRDLDIALQRQNSNYHQKRTNDFAIDRLEVIPLPTGFFENWLRRKGKIGGQHKVPKLANHRRFAEEILASIPSDAVDLH